MSGNAVRSDLTTLQCTSERTWCAVYRCSSFVLLTFLLVVCLVTSGYAHKTFIFLTYWSFALLVLDNLFALVNTLRPGRTGFYGNEEPDSRLDGLLKLQWLLFSVSSSAAFVVTLMFWLLEYKGTGLTVCNVILHVFNSMFVITNVIVTSTPIYFKDWIYTSALGGIYGVFTVIYWLLGGTNHKEEPFIYSALDYSSRPVKATILLIVTCFVAVPLSQTVLVLLHNYSRSTRYQNHRTADRYSKAFFV